MGKYIGFAVLILGTFLFGFLAVSAANNCADKEATQVLQVAFMFFLCLDIVAVCLLLLDNPRLNK